ncbi:kinase-like protein, partial [Amylocystis lapponica]
MCCYPVQLPPLSLSSSKRAPLARRGSDDFRHAPATLTHRRVANDKLVSPRPPHTHVIPLSISTALSAASSPSSSPSSSPYLSSKQFPRSPLVPLPRQLPPSPVSHSTYASASVSSTGSSISSTLVDVLSQGDLVGEGLSLQGETISRVPRTPSEPRVDYDEPAKEFEVVRKLGTGSYAVVYLVREVLSRAPPSDDGHVAALLSKANLDEEAWPHSCSRYATIHQSLPAHPNIVTLHRTLETRSFLLLLLEFVPGEDLFYFLEQARDHYETDPASPDLSTSPPSDSSCTRTPPTPSLLSSLNPAQLLSRTRLRLIASMFSQMCEAVATCHDHSVFHRDIKPENFIVTDGWTTSSDGRRERKVFVKLTDFGLSTTDTESADMDCGSAPYMSFECRNNLHPTYSPRAADVWSLGIVLINMLYHYNPWTDTTQGACSSFELYRQQPVNFFMQRFAGMTLPVAQFLTNNVFCILTDPRDNSQRISAHAFGAWIKDLPTLLGSSSHSSHTRNVSVTSVQGFSLSSVPHSRRPSLRNVPLKEVSQRASKSLSRAPSLGPAYELDVETPSGLSTVYDQEFDGEVETESRSTSTHKRRKRGARKGKGAIASPISDDTLDTLAEASQALAREISRTSRTSQSVPSLYSLAESQAPAEPIPPVPPVPIALSSSTASSSISKKSSKWKLSFGKASSAAVGKVPPVEEAPSEASTGSSGKMSATASNVTSLLMSLNAPPVSRSSPPSSQPDTDDVATWASRGRRPTVPTYANGNGTWGPSSGIAFTSPERRAFAADKDRRSERGVSPTSTRSGRPIASSASSMASSNWRSSMSSAGTSAFTRYSNGSSRSVSTAATSLSSNSWRSQNSKNTVDNRPPLPANVKFVTGTPWELGQLPRQMYHNPEEVKYSGPPVRKRRTQKPQDSTLDTISERPHKPPVAQRQDAATSTTDLDGIARDRDEDGAYEGTPRKVQKGQINALAKMLSALRR